MPSKYLGQVCISRSSAQGQGHKIHVCLIRTLIFECFDLATSFSVRRYIFTTSRSRSWGHRLRHTHSWVVYFRLKLQCFFLLFPGHQATFRCGWRTCYSNMPGSDIKRIRFVLSSLYTSHVLLCYLSYNSAFSRVWKRALFWRVCQINEHDADDLLLPTRHSRGTQEIPNLSECRRHVDLEMSGCVARWVTDVSL